MPAHFNIIDEARRGLPWVATDLIREVDLSQEAIQREMNLQLCAVGVAYGSGGPITQAVLETIYTAFILDLTYLENVCVEVRTHFIERGDVPVFNTAWHVDAEPTFRSQEAHLNTIHHLFLSGPPLTEFIERRNLTIFNHNKLSGETRIQAPAGRIVRYNSTELHRATAWWGDKPVWRYFFRLTSFPVLPRRSDVFANKVYKGPTNYKVPR